ILRWREVAPIIGCSRMTIARMEKAGTFPQRIRIGNGSVGWLEHEVEAWLAQRMAVAAMQRAPARRGRGGGGNWATGWR
ncbi:MAG TPA: AlpA family phage regulatory protein, partial [Alphaproteobacteria bacterium]|nr:AlpA family phage regulatory protein [Alphaproteobacteria bacterium]